MEFKCNSWDVPVYFVYFEGGVGWDSAQEAYL